MSGPVDVLAVMANPRGYCNGGRWTTGHVAAWIRLGGQQVTTGQTLTSLRREERKGNVVCLGPTSEIPGWHGNNIAFRAELQWRLCDEYAKAHGNEACLDALANAGGAA